MLIKIVINLFENKDFIKINLKIDIKVDLK